MPLRDRSRRILQAISGGYAYERILKEGWADTNADIMHAAQEALTAAGDAVGEPAGMATSTSETPPDAHQRQAYQSLVNAVFDEGQPRGPARGSPSAQAKSSHGRQPISPERAAEWEEMKSRVKAAYSNAWEPWSKDEEEKLAALFAAGRTVNEIALELGRKPEGIQARLVKLRLV